MPDNTRRSKNTCLQRRVSMKRILIPIIAAAISLCMFGCASNDASSDATQSSGAETQASTSDSGASSADASSQQSSDSQESATDLHGITGPISEPPIPCTKKATLGNVSIMVPEDWTAEVGIGGYLKINSGDNIVGSLSIEESDLNASSSDEDVMVFVNQTMEAQKDAGFTIEEGLKVERKGNLAYVLVPFSAEQEDANGKTQNFWGYSMCGYDDELIIVDMSDTENDKDVLMTFRWIIENLQVN